MTLTLMTLNLLFPPRVKVGSSSVEPGRGFLLKDVNSYKTIYSRSTCKIDSEYLLVSNIFLVLFALTAYLGATLFKEQVEAEAEAEAKANSTGEYSDSSVC